MKKFIILFSISVILSSCATAYQPKGFGGGYEETQLDDNVFKIAFRGNSFASKERVNDFCLLRCCEVTLDHGYKYFVIKNNQDLGTSSTEYVQQKDYRGNVSVQERTQKREKVELTIECTKDKPNTESAVYNAQMTSNNIKHNYGL